MHEDEYWAPQALPPTVPVSSTDNRCLREPRHSASQALQPRRSQTRLTPAAFAEESGARGRWWRHAALPPRDRHLESRSGVLPDRGRRGRDRLHPRGSRDVQARHVRRRQLPRRDLHAVEERTEIQLQAQGGRASSTAGYGEVTAEDVKYSYERIAGLTKPNIHSPYSGDWSTLKEVKVTGKYTGTIILKERFSPLLHSTLPAGSGLVLSKKALLKLGNKGIAVHPIGTGPYDVHQVDAQAEGHPHEEPRLRRQQQGVRQGQDL